MYLLVYYLILSFVYIIKNTILNHSTEDVIIMKYFFSGIYPLNQNEASRWQFQLYCLFAISPSEKRRLVRHPWHRRKSGTARTKTSATKGHRPDHFPHTI